jgi:5-deoxy-glucuronate isomerase
MSATPAPAVTDRRGPDLTDDQWTRLLTLRAADPDAVTRAYASRKRPNRILSERGTLFLVAADHPARGALASGGDAMAMADRRSLLARLMAALQHPDVDGVLGTPDVVEELLLLGALEGKVVIGSMNRGGLDGASWTMDDRFTGYDAASIAANNLEGGKMLLRIDDRDPSTAGTIEGCATAVSELADLGLLAMVEPLPYHREDGDKLTLLRDTRSLARAVTIASGLGTTSAHTWLKMPSCDDPRTVFAATTLPCGVLGGARPGHRASPALSAGWRRPCCCRCRGERAACCSLRGRLVIQPRTWTGREVDEDTVVDFTPTDAGWDWTGLSVLRLRAGQPRVLRMGATEAFVLPLSGSVTVEVADEGGASLGAFHLSGRETVFTAVTDFAYVGRDSTVTLCSAAGAEVALPSSRCERVLPPLYGAAAEVPVEVRGAGSATRQVTNFGVPGVWDHADKLICCELITPPGNWSSYPPHKRDASEPCTVANEEIYYYRIAGADQITPSRDGFGFHRTYTGPEHERAGLTPLDELAEVRDHDVILVPHGYHGPCVAAPGYPMYYLNVMAGPAADRALAFCDDLDHGWVRDSWADMPTDPRCPVTSAHGRLDDLMASPRERHS